MTSDFFLSFLFWVFKHHSCKRIDGDEISIRSFNFLGEDNGLARLEEEVTVTPENDNYSDIFFKKGKCDYDIISKLLTKN